MTSFFPSPAGFAGAVGFSVVRFGSSSNSDADKHPRASKNPARPFRFRFFLCVDGWPVERVVWEVDAAGAGVEVDAGAVVWVDGLGVKVVTAGVAFSASPCVVVAAFPLALPDSCLVSFCIGPGFALAFSLDVRGSC